MHKLSNLDRLNALEYHNRVLSISFARSIAEHKYYLLMETKAKNEVQTMTDEKTHTLIFDNAGRLSTDWAQSIYKKDMLHLRKSGKLESESEFTIADAVVRAKLEADIAQSKGVAASAERLRQWDMVSK